MLATPTNARGSSVPGGSRSGEYEEYHPYGSTAWHAFDSSKQVSAKRYRYTGMERDEETGLQCHGIRYYAPWVGRWTSADPAGLSDGVNRYCHVRGAPTQLVDPAGTESAPPAGLWSQNEQVMGHLSEQLNQELAASKSKVRTSVTNADGRYGLTIGDGAGPGWLEGFRDIRDAGVSIEIRLAGPNDAIMPTKGAAAPYGAGAETLDTAARADTDSFRTVLEALAAKRGETLPPFETPPGVTIPTDRLITMKAKRLVDIMVGVHERIAPAEPVPSEAIEASVTRLASGLAASERSFKAAEGTADAVIYLDARFGSGDLAYNGGSVSVADVVVHEALTHVLGYIMPSRLSNGAIAPASPLYGDVPAWGDMVSMRLSAYLLGTAARHPEVDATRAWLAADPLAHEDFESTRFGWKRR